jgi:CubicO group peptidase (beta-lactamase class C family)
MKKKIVGVFVCMLLIGTVFFPVSGKMMMPNNFNEKFSEYIFTENGNFPIENELDKFIINKMSESHIPGLSATIMKNDSVFWTKSYGYANISSDKMVKDTTLFRLASVSKTIIATAIMQLYDQGNFGLHDSINKYLDFQVIHPDYPSTNITFHMLMTHTSAIRDNWAVMPIIYGDPTIPLGEYLEEYLTPGGAFYHQDLNFHSFEPGTDYEYSNIGSCLVAYLVEVISNEPFDEYCENNVFQPLDMPETAWFLADLNISNIAVPYTWNGENYVPYPHYSLNGYPAGGLRTSVTQLRNLLQMMINKGEYNSTQILQESTVELMLTIQFGFAPFQGIIWRIKLLDGRMLWGHAGSFRGCRTSMFFDPRTSIGVVVLTNREYGHDDILDAIFDFAENLPPDIPMIIGPTSGKPRKSYDYVFDTTDPDEQNVSFYVDWGDDSITNWTEFVTSGTSITLTHKWKKQGTYIIKARAKDIYDSESDWSEFEVNIPRFSNNNFKTVNLFFERYPNIFPILRYLFYIIKSLQ